MAASPPSLSAGSITGEVDVALAHLATREGRHARLQRPEDALALVVAAAAALRVGKVAAHARGWSTGK